MRICGLCLHLHCFLTYLFSLILFPFTLSYCIHCGKKRGYVSGSISIWVWSWAALPGVSNPVRGRHTRFSRSQSHQNLLLGIHTLRQSILHQIKGVSNSTLAECSTQMSDYDVYIAPTLPHLPPFLFLHLMRNLYLNRTLSTMAAGKCWCSVRVALWFLSPLLKIHRPWISPPHYFVSLWTHFLPYSANVLTLDGLQTYLKAHLSHPCNNCKAYYSGMHKATPQDWVVSDY